jgi:hypothetical protein
MMNGTIMELYFGIEYESVFTNGMHGDMEKRGL